MSIRWTEEEYAEWLRENRRSTAINPAVPTAHVERDPGHESPRADEAQEVHPRFRIRIHHRSRRLADATGRSHKAAVDGIVRGGILRDDSPRFLAEIVETYEKAGVDETVITVESIEADR